ncbi:MAG: tetratricopeptide repeat protein [Roseivirga sp.]|nr:tetratricopeptide repeat protein [Roseivirga sp.]
MKSALTPFVVILGLFLSLNSQAQSPKFEVNVSSFTDTLIGRVGEIDRDVIGNLFVADFGEKVWKISPLGEVEVFTNTMYGSSGNALDAQGNLFQAQYYGNTIVKVNRYTREVSEVAHKGLVGPVGLAFLNNELYVCNCNNNTIAKVEKTGEVTQVASGPLFNCPNGLIAGRDGNLYVVNYRNPNIVKVDAAGTATLFAKLPATSGGHITELKGNFFVTSFFDHKIFKVSGDGKVTHFAGTGVAGVKNGKGLESQFINPNGIVATNGSLFVNDKIPGPGGQGWRTVIRRISFPDFSAVISRALASGGLKQVETVYKAYKESSFFKNDRTEGEMNFLAYGQLTSGQHDIAIGLFKLNADSYPESFNTWDSLAEGYLTKGDKKNARKYYKKSLELNPQNTNAAEKLKELQ